MLPDSDRSEDHLSSFLAALQSAEEQTDDAQQRTMLKRARDGLAGGTSGLLFPVTAALMGRPERLPLTSTLTLSGRLSYLRLAPPFMHVLFTWTGRDGWQACDVNA